MEKTTHCMTPSVWMFIKDNSVATGRRQWHPHSSTLAWKIPWTEEPGRLQSMGLLRVGHDWVTLLSLFTLMHWRRKWQPTPVILAWRVPGTEEPGGLAVYGVAKQLSSSSSSSSIATESRSEYPGLSMGTSLTKNGHQGTFFFFPKALLELGWTW